MAPVPVLLCSLLAAAAPAAPKAPPAQKAVPAGPPSVALFSIEARGDVKPEMAAVLTDLTVDELRATKQFSRVVSQREIETVMGVERQRQLLDCTDSSCIAEIAGSLGVDLVMSGALARLGTAWVLQLRLLRTRDGSAASSLSARACADSEDQAVALISPAVRKAVKDAGFAVEVPALPPPDCSGKPTAVATPNPGTPDPAAMATPEKAPEMGAAEKPSGGGPLPKLLKGAGSALVALGAGGLPLALGLAAGGGALLAGFYVSPEARAVFNQGANNFWIAHVPSVAMWAAGGGVVLLGLLTTVVGVAVLVAGVVL